jgi:predicted dehydrogenase
MAPLSEYTRREFLGSSARHAAGVAAGVVGLQAAAGDQAPIRVGCIGLGQQGRQWLKLLAERSDVCIVGLCDVDPRQISEALRLLPQAGHSDLLIASEHERLLERSEIEALIVATPAHWHYPLALEACAAGKDLLLEQPIGLNIAEGQAVEAAARETGRIVQTGLPQRSGSHFRSAVELIQRGELGKVIQAKGWATHKRRSLGRSIPSVPPVGVDYARWLGRAPQRPFQVSRFHQDWPYYWDYGLGELGLWGVQQLDVIRWALQLEDPLRVAAIGSQRVLGDDRETPETLQVLFEFEDVAVEWEHRQWSPRGIEGRTTGVAFYGTAGTLILDRSGWKVYDRQESLTADASELYRPHLDQFLRAVRTRELPNADIGIGRCSLELCHWAHAAYQRREQLTPADFSTVEPVHLSNPFPEA